MNEQFEDTDKEEAFARVREIRKEIAQYDCFSDEKLNAIKNQGRL